MMRLRRMASALLLWSSLALAAGQQLSLTLPEPDLRAADPLVRRSLEQARADAVATIQAPGNTDAERGRALGELGQRYDAHLVLDAAASCYRQAAELEPDAFRWPYYLGYLLQRTGALEEATEAYGRALALAPNDALTELRMGQIELELGRIDDAELRLQQALADPGLAGSAWFELGKLAYTRSQPALAAERLEQALVASPYASRIHYTLALAYRALGESEKARAQLALHGEREPEIADPWVEAVEALSSGQRMRFFLGAGAAQQHEYAEAAEYFRDGLALDPDNLDARVSFARFLYLSGDREAAGTELQMVLQSDPAQVLANFLLGLWYAEGGERDAALRHLSAALEREPLHSGSHFYLGELYAAAGETEAAGRHFALALEQAPENSAARLRWILALIDQGADHRSLAGILEDALARHPEVEAFAYFLSALYAASPDPEVRDGARALALAQSLYQGHLSAEHAELLAMAHAELGAFSRAVQSEQQSLELAAAEGRWYLMPRLLENQARFRQGKPCRKPWAEGSLLRQLAPASLSKPFRDYPAEVSY